MFTLDETFSDYIVYISQRIYYGKFFLYFFGAVCFLEFFRTQISEVRLLQLIPGLFFFLFIISFVLFSYFSYLSGSFAYKVDTVKGYGTKVQGKMLFGTLMKYSFSLFSSLVIISLNTVLPLSLDSLNSSGQKTLENTWSLTEVLLVEILLLLVLAVISQIPVVFMLNFNTPVSILTVTQFWKTIIISFTIIAGLVTPTLDGYTQLCLALSSFSFYLFIVNLLQKRTVIKLNEFLPFG